MDVDTLNVCLNLTTIEKKEFPFKDSWVKTFVSDFHL